MHVGVIGCGMVGAQLVRYFQEIKKYQRGQELFCYDIDPKLGYFDDISRADVIFVCVPTPPNPDGSCNISMVREAVSKIPDHRIVVIKSTVPPGTTEQLQKENPNKRLIFNPEFLTESQAWEDFLRPSRQIIGVTKESAAYAVLVLNLLPHGSFTVPYETHNTKRFATATEAELVKYASNIFGYIKVMYGNILADISYELGINYESVREMMAADLRIGPAWLDVNHGNYCGAGGYCFPKDMNAFLKFLNSRMKSPQMVYGEAFLKAAREYNRTLLLEQGLTEEEVSQHNKDLIIKKRKKIRGK